MTSILAGTFFQQVKHFHLSQSLAGGKIINFLNVQMSRNSEDSQTKWRLWIELSEHISNTIFTMKATIPALPSYLFIILNVKKD